MTVVAVKKIITDIVSTFADLRILTGKTHTQVKLQRLRKVSIWVFEYLVD